MTVNFMYGYLFSIGKFKHSHTNKRSVRSIWRSSVLKIYQPPLFCAPYDGNILQRSYRFVFKALEITLGYLLSALHTAILSLKALICSLFCALYDGKFTLRLSFFCWKTQAFSY